MANSKRGPKIDPFCKSWDALSLFRALKIRGLTGKRAMYFATAISGVSERKIKQLDIKTRDAKDGTGRKAELSLSAINNDSEVLNAQAGIIKHNWLDQARAMGIVDILK